MDATNRRILIAGIVSDEYTVSINFTTTLIRLQQRIASQGAHSCPVTFEFFRHVDDAVMFFQKDQTITRLVVLDGGMSCDIDFLLFPHPPEVVIPAYPVRGVNWSKISSLMETTSTVDVDQVRRAGMEYNFVPRGSSCALDAGRYVEAECPQAKIISMSRKGAETVASRYDPKSCKLDTICMIDVTAKCVNAGPYDFTGCVGTRLLQGIHRQ